MMKFKTTLLLPLLLFSAMLSEAANFRFLPHTVKQPDGTTISCFVSGDEYFNWLHDKDGYTIIQADDGYYYWGVKSGDHVVPTSLRADSTDPAAAGLAKWAKISPDLYKERRAFYTVTTDSPVRAPHSGTLNNIVIYIRFSDDTEFTTLRQAYDDKFNLPAGQSLKSYFKEVSYSSLTISSTHYPECAMTTNYSYQDTHVRSYFEPYNATSNPGGYSGNTQRRDREHALLVDAVTWVNTMSPVPADLELDGDNDGLVDNVSFIIRGGNGAWAELLWAHRWSLYSQYVTINGKQVFDYTFEPESQVDVTTICHEMFHALGAPDLYHYTDDGIAPAGPWDLMESGSGHMGAYMKWKYTGNTWIAEMPEITVTGTYTLHPLSSPANNCYKIASPNSPDQFFVVEYRRKEGTFENSLPGSGLLVYRIDPSLDGNADGPPDEVYIFRPGGTVSANGTPTNAYFSAGIHRTRINGGTDPYPFLQDGSPGGLDISNITEADTTISFTVTVFNINDPLGFAATGTTKSDVVLSWQKNPSGSDVMIAFDTVDQFGEPVNGTSYAPGSQVAGGGQVICNGPGTMFSHTGLLSNKTYYYKAWSVLPGTSYSPGLVRKAVTLCETITVLPFTEGFEGSSDRPGCWLEDNTDPAWKFMAGNGLGPGYGYPGTAHTGLHNASLADATKVADYNTLATPMISLSGYTDVKLKFWMFMQKWGTRQDELTVSYRTNPADPWIVLQQYSQSVSSWTEQTIDLPPGLNDVQLGFRGNARWALGVCIDDIELSGTPAQALIITPGTVNVTRTAGTAEFAVACPVGWDAASDVPAWCTVTPSGTGNGTLTATYTENTTYSKRTAAITISAAGLPSQTVTIIQDASNISVGENPSQGVQIYPNPAGNTCRITDRSGEMHIREITFTDFAGRVVLSRKAEGETLFGFDLSALSAGTYAVKIRGEHRVSVHKLVVVR